MVDDAPDKGAPARLQHIYVDLQTTAPPSAALFGRRLALPLNERTLLARLRALLPNEFSHRSTTDLFQQGWENLRRLDDEQREAAAKALGVGAP
ncbi:MAG: hypothetical protein KDE46_28680, partial [Caldilineaceae bacterium]|nr:hypothetical protein [Caldilineaceae bacterium]